MVAHPSLTGASGRATRTPRTAGQAKSRVGAQSIIEPGTPRPVYDSSQPEPTVAGALTRFFPGLSKFADAWTKDNEIEIKRKNTAILAGLKAKIDLNPEAADRAMRSGDFSAFTTNPKQAGHAIWQDFFMSQAGKSSAYADRDELENYIGDTPPTSDPEAWVTDFLVKKTEEANPLYQSAYMQVARNIAGPLIDTLRDQRRKAGIERVILKGRRNLENDIQSGQTQLTSEYLNKARDDLLGATGDTSPATRDKVDAAIADAVMSRAAAGDTQAHALMLLPDKQKDGISIYDEYRDRYANILASALTNQAAVKSMAMKAAMNGIDEARDRRTLLGQSQVDTLHELSLFGREWGKASPWFKQQRRAIISLLTAQGNEVSQGASMAAGEPGRGKPGKQDNYMAKTVRGQGFYDYAQRSGISRAQADDVVVARLGNTETRSNTRTAIRETFLQATQNNATDEQLQAAEDLEGLLIRAKAARKRPWSWSVGPEVVQWMVAREFILDGKWNIGDQRKKMFEADEALTGKVPGHYSRRLGADGQALGQGVTNQLSIDLWDALGPDNLGFDPDTEPKLWGLFGLTKKVPFSELPYAIKQLHRAAIDNASYLAAINGFGSDEDTIKDLASRFFMGKLNLKTLPDGRHVVQLRGHNLIMMTPDGTAFELDPENEDRVDAISTAWKTAPFTELLDRLYGKTGGFERWEGTDRNGRLAVLVEGPNGPQRLVITTEERVILKPTADFPLEQFSAGGAGSIYGQALLPSAPRPGTTTELMDMLGSLNELFVVTPLEDGTGWTLSGVEPTDDVRSLPVPGVAWQTFEWSDRDQGWQITVDRPSREDTGVAAQQINEMSDDQLADRMDDKVSGYLRSRGFATGRAAKTLAAMMRDRALSSLTKSPPGYDGYASNHDRFQAGVSMHEDARRGTEDAMGAALVADSDQSLLVPKPRPTEVPDELLDLVDEDAGERMYADEMGFRLNANIPVGQNRRPFNALEMTGFAQMVRKDTMETDEGFVEYVYDPMTKASMKGKNRIKGSLRLVGYAFNVDRVDAEELLNLVGTTRARILAGETMSRTQARKLFDITIGKDDTWLRLHFANVRMEDHRWAVLLGMVYESTRTKTGPRLIGPKITAAVEEGRWLDAAFEIMFNSDRNLDARMQKGQRLRRLRGVERFLGPEDNETFLKLWNAEIWDPRWPMNVLELIRRGEL